MITIEIKGADEAATKFRAYPDKATRALVRAMNRGINSARTVVVRGIASETYLPQSAVRDALKLRQATATNQVASLAASLKKIPLIEFHARGPEPSRGRGNGVSYRLKSGRNRIPNAFIATVGNGGHKGVFVRVGAQRKSRGAWSKNLPIKERFGPSLGSVFKKFRPEAIARANEIMAKNLGHELQWAAQEDANA